MILRGKKFKLSGSHELALVFRLECIAWVAVRAVGGGILGAHTLEEGGKVSARRRLFL